MNPSLHHNNRFSLSLKQRTNTCHRYQQNLRTSAAESCAAQFSWTTSSHLLKSARSSYYAYHKFGTGAHDRHQNDRHQTGIKGHCNCTLRHQLGINLIADSVPSNAKNGLPTSHASTLPTYAATLVLMRLQCSAVRYKTYFLYSTKTRGMCTCFDACHVRTAPVLRTLWTSLEPWDTWSTTHKPLPEKRYPLTSLQL